VCGGVLYTQQHTLLKDLSPSEDEIFQSFGKHLRQYIKKSKSEQKISIEIYDAEQLKKTPSILFECKNLYEKMFKDKGMSEVFNDKLANIYINQQALCIAMAFDNRTAIGFSAVIYKEINARLWLAAFDFRNVDFDSQVLSRAHQRLDWELLRWCKNEGITQFDFGGVNSFDEPNGIAQFKMKFEDKNRVTYNNYLVPNSFLGKIALKIFMRKRG
jgi:hypothetical protein